MKIVNILKLVGSTFISLLTFHFLLAIYLLNFIVVVNILRAPFLPKKLIALIERCVGRVYDRAIKWFDRPGQGTIMRSDLIELAIRNMRSKITRSIITISGMSIGIGAIVFLVSIGYGIQNLVTSRVARLDEMQQADVAPQPGGKVQINDKTIADFKALPNTKHVLPQISAVGKITYNNAVSDMAVYGVTADYLKQSAVQPVEGKIFESNDLAASVSNLPQNNSKEESTASGVLGDSIRKVSFQVYPDTWVKIREKATNTSKILGYTRRSESPTYGSEVLGDYYLDDATPRVGADGKKLSVWVSAEVEIWDAKSCTETQAGCVDGKYLKRLDEEGFGVTVSGYLASTFLAISEPVPDDPAVLGVMYSEVLAEATGSGSLAESEESTASADAALLASLASESGVLSEKPVKQLVLSESSVKEAVVNYAMLKVLGLKESEAVGKTFDASFVLTGSQLDGKDDKAESVPAPYKIVGVVPDDKTPYFYVPFVDLRNLGVLNYSQIKLVAKSQEDLPKLRKQVEGLGYGTQSVVDTVAQINSIFATARTVLALLGMVALSIASLGMFNTLTVSLLERTREVGLMKAMGMRSSEVRELFLTESMMMGIFGGLFGLLTGYLAGEGLGLILSLVGLSKGAGYLDIAYIPPYFVTVIIVLSLVVGIATGIYPARRATKISALNALRYE
jgi:ABC-type lipoprotein release transport system permease subunit